MRNARQFKVRKRKVIFAKGPIYLVDCDVEMPGGKILHRQVLEHPGSVVIIPKIGPDRFILIRQFRFAAGKWLWEFPAGGVEQGETFRWAAARELAEETGYRPKRLTELVRVYPTPGISGELMHLYLAEKLVPYAADGDEDEAIELCEFTSNGIERMIRSGRIIDAKTIAGYLYLKRFGVPRR